MKSYLDETLCDCGKKHSVQIDDIIIGKGAIKKIPEFVQNYGCKKAFILADTNTFAAAGEAVCSVLNNASIAFSKYIFQTERLEPNEETVGSACMHFDTSCDIIIGVGSGVINDTGKILSNLTGKKYIIVATAPSMDGYASATSSMSMDGIKVSLNSRCADVIIGDTDILRNAPEHMLRAGLGDMLAKYVSIAEWRISHLITGEYYCEQVASLIRSAVKKCVENAENLLKREDAAVEAVFEGLVVGGIAMAYAGMSRPASGIEHYFSHIWDMRGLEFGIQVDLHGIQCALGTLVTAKLYDALKEMTPNKSVAEKFVSSFSYDNWKQSLREFLGKSAEGMIALEAKEQKYAKVSHPARFELICKNWNAILQILTEELPAYDALIKIYDTIGMETDLSGVGVDAETAKLTFKATKDIRDKYVLSRLAWDLGVLDELSNLL